MGNGLNKTLKIIILGLENSGKSTLYHRIKNNKFVLARPTNGSICETFKSKLKSSIIYNSTIQLLDVNGRQNCRSMWVTYLHGASAIIFVIDVSDNARLEEAKLELQGLVMSDNSKEIPILVLLNKIDKERCRDPVVVTNYLDLVSLDGGRWWVVKCVCLVTGENLCHAIDALCDIVKLAKSKNRTPPFKTNDYIIKSLNKHDYSFTQ